MSIDLTTEQVLSLRRACDFLPARRAGKRPNVATLYRWAQRGCRGVRLETIRVGGTLCTSLEALQRFCEALTSTSNVAPSRYTAKQRERAVEQARRDLNQP